MSVQIAAEMGGDCAGEEGREACSLGCGSNYRDQGRNPEVRLLFGCASC